MDTKNEKGLYPQPGQDKLVILSESGHNTREVMHPQLETGRKQVANKLPDAGVRTS